MTRPQLSAVAQQRGKVQAEVSGAIGEYAAGRLWMKVTAAKITAQLPNRTNAPPASTYPNFERTRVGQIVRGQASLAHWITLLRAG